MRKCDNCKTKMAPYVPRKKVSGQYLCPACVRSERGGYVSAAKTADATSSDAWGSDLFDNLSDDHDGMFPSGLEPSGSHPIAAPLPATTWKNYQSKRRLKGLSDYPTRVFKPAKNPRMTREELLAAFKAKNDARRQASLRTQAHMPGLPHPDTMNNAEMAEHLNNEHGYQAHGMPYSSDHPGLHEAHKNEHTNINYGQDPAHTGNPINNSSSFQAEHAHIHSGDPVPAHAEPTTVPMTHDMTGEDLVAHLKDHHGFGSVDPDDVDGMKNLHSNDHLNVNYGHDEGHEGCHPSHTEHPHVHQWEQGQSSPSIPNHPPVGLMTKEEIASHLQAHHGLDADPDADLETLETLHGSDHGDVNYGKEPGHVGAEPVGYKGEKHHTHGMALETPAKPKFTMHPHVDEMDLDALKKHLKDEHDYHDGVISQWVDEAQNAEIPVHEYLKHQHGISHETNNYGKEIGHKGSQIETSWGDVPHAHMPKTHVLPHAEPVTYSTHPNATSDKIHEEEYGTPEHPKFSAHVPEEFAHSPEFHHLVQHHGLDANHPALSEYKNEPGKQEQFLGNWTTHVHNPHTSQGQDQGHWGLKHWNHDQDDSGKLLDQPKTSNHPAALDDWEHELLHGTPADPSFPDHIPDEIAFDPHFHHLVQHHGFDVNHAHAKQYLPNFDDENKANFGVNWCQKVHNEGGTEAPQGTQQMWYGLKTWDHTKDKDGNPLGGAPKHFAQSGSVSPGALSDAEHEAKYGTPENPHFGDNVPDHVAQDPGFHHLVQHHGLDPAKVVAKHSGLDGFPASNEAVKNWVNRVHGFDTVGNKEPVQHPDGSSVSLMHGLYHWHHGADKALGSDETFAPTSASPAEQAKVDAAKKHLLEDHKMDPLYVNGLTSEQLADKHKGAHASDTGQLHHAHDEHGTQVTLGVNDQSLPHHDDMSPAALSQHLKDYHHSIPMGDWSHEDLKREHDDLHANAEHMASGAVAHMHKAPLSMFDDPTVGREGEWLGAKTLPKTKSKDDVIAHLNAHHPNASIEDYDASQFHTNGGGLAAWHQHLHTLEGANAGLGAPDHHTHELPAPVKTEIPVGVHLKTHHGMSQEDIAAMTPAEFKAHHERLHDEGDDEEIGHSHAYPAGPVTPPAKYLKNSEYEGTEHEYTWWHGTQGDYDGPPLDSTTKKRNTGVAGNYDNDWNCHAGSHWTTLHKFARDFGSGHRVIAAKIRMKNPKYYDNLNHMAHDAYDRLRAIGEINDGGTYDNNHTSSNYGSCCSQTLSQYAHGGAGRPDGKHGLQKFRDSLRADGYDGIIARNHADTPHGQMNAIVFSPHDIEITDPKCGLSHGDERDQDATRFSPPHGWDRYAPYTRADKFPSKEEVEAAGEKEKQRRAGLLAGAHPDPDFHSHEMTGNGHAHSPVTSYDPHSSDDEDDEGEGAYCNHCDVEGHSDNDDDEHYHCDVCDEYGHEKDSGKHPYCDHCGEYTDHDSTEHEDEHGEHPDNYKAQDYCPSCGTYNKENRDSKECVECDAELPDWNKTIAHGTPLAAWKGGHISSDNGKPAIAEIYPKTGYPHPGDLAEHLKTEHGSDLSGAHFKQAGGNDDDWDNDALMAHHAWLHHNPDQAKEEGFPTFDHIHSHLPTFKPGAKMSPQEMKVHMQLDHKGVQKVQGLSDEEIAALHEAEHAEDGPEHDYTDFYNHNHHASGDVGNPVHPNSAPKGLEETKAHLASSHGITISGANAADDGDNPEWWAAIHEKAHLPAHAKGISGAPGPDHAHTEHGVEWAGTPNVDESVSHTTGIKPGFANAEQWHAHQALTQHLINGHGLSASDAKAQGKVYGKPSWSALVKAHLQDHLTNPKAGAHSHENKQQTIHDHLDDIKSHLCVDHGQDMDAIDHLSDDVLHANHEKLHAEAEANAEPIHSHHGGAEDHVVPESLGGSAPLSSGTGYSNYWNTPSVISHLKEAHGYTAPPGALNTDEAIQGLHRFWHEHPEHAIEHGYAIDHGHSANGGMVAAVHPFVGPKDAHGLLHHLNEYHHDVKDQVKEKFPSAYVDPEGMHAFHEKLHEDGEGLAQHHSHQPDPDKPIVDDPSINDKLAKHLVSKHGWNAASDFEGKTNQDLMDAHHGAHHSLNPEDPHPQHTHDKNDWALLHARDGKKAIAPVGSTYTNIEDHLYDHHDHLGDKVGAILDAAGTPPEGQTWNNWAADVLHQHHQMLHTSGTEDLNHEHPWGLRTDDAKKHLMNHIINWHGYSASTHALESHPDLEGFHNQLHGEGGDAMHASPAFNLFGHGVTWHHHDPEIQTNDVQQMLGGKPESNDWHTKHETMQAPVPVPVPSWKDNDAHAKIKHLVEHHGYSLDYATGLHAAGPHFLDTDHNSLHVYNNTSGDSPHVHAQPGEQVPEQPAEPELEGHPHYMGMTNIDKVKHLVHEHGVDVKKAKKSVQEGTSLIVHTMAHQDGEGGTEHYHHTTQPKTSSYQANLVGSVLDPAEFFRQMEVAP